MPIRGVKLCNAKCRTKGGAPCLGPGMKNGRCRMHGGVFYKEGNAWWEGITGASDAEKRAALLKGNKGG